MKAKMNHKEAYKKLKTQTLISEARFSTIEKFRDHASKNSIIGDVVECGTWKGGAFAYITKICLELSLGNSWGFDSYEGLPQPTTEDGDKAFERMKKPNKLEASINDVRNSLKIMNIDPDDPRIKIIKGWFDDTICVKKNEIEKISFLRLDGDWYDSTKCCLDNLYDLVVPKGFIVIDDYGHWLGCRKAVDEFRNDRKITTKLQKTDYTEYLWIKE